MLPAWLAVIGAIVVCDASYFKNGFTLKDVEVGIELAADYLVSHVNLDGSTAYRVNIDGQPVKSDYNVLRHAGAGYALDRYLTLYKHNQTVVSALLRLAKWLPPHTFEALTEDPEAIAVYSEPYIGEPGRRRPTRSKLGGAGLALIALSAASTHRAQSIPLNNLTGVVRFIQHLQIDSGEYHSFYVKGHGPSKRSSSLYYPGEATLALLTAHRVLLSTNANSSHEPTPHSVLRSAVKGLDFLAQSRVNEGAHVPVDHWAMIATRALLFGWDGAPATADAHRKGPTASTDSEGERVRSMYHGVDVNVSSLRYHTQQVMEALIGFVSAVRDGSELLGSLGFTGGVPPTATMVEAITAALPVLHPEGGASDAEDDGGDGKGFDDDRVDALMHDRPIHRSVLDTRLPPAALPRILRHLRRRGVAFILDAMVRDGPAAGGLPGAYLGNVSESGDFISLQEAIGKGAMANEGTQRDAPKERGGWSAGHFARLHHVHHTRGREVRIDNVQHALCALLGYYAAHGGKPKLQQMQAGDDA